MKEKRSFGNKMLTVIFSIISVIYLLPIVVVLINSFKQKTFINLEPFTIPTKADKILPCECEKENCTTIIFEQREELDNI